MGSTWSDLDIIPDTEDAVEMPDVRLAAFFSAKVPTRPVRWTTASRTATRMGAFYPSPVVIQQETDQLHAQPGRSSWFQTDASTRAMFRPTSESASCRVKTPN
jgi:hypothetical protein